MRETVDKVIKFGWDGVSGRVDGSSPEMNSDVSVGMMDKDREARD
jgi:hypothetical protein